MDEKENENALDNCFGEISPLFDTFLAEKQCSAVLRSSQRG